MNKTVLVTGGLGFIGSYVLEELIKSNYKIIVIDNYSHVANFTVPSSIHIVKTDIRDPEIESIFIENKINYCIHLAAQVSVAESQIDPGYDANVNIQGSLNIFRLCQKYCVDKVIVASSAAVYGTPKSLPIKEDHTCEPLSFYGLSKLTMENYLKLFEIPYLIFRFANVYGPRQDPSGEAGVIAIFNNLIKSGKDVYIDGDGTQTRDFVFVKDIASILVESLSVDFQNETINLATNIEYSINDLFTMLKKLYASESKVAYRASRPGDIYRSVLDNSKLKKFFHHKQFADLMSGCKSFVDIK